MLYRFGVVRVCGTVLLVMTCGLSSVLLRACRLPFNSAISLPSSSFMPFIVCNKKDISLRFMELGFCICWTGLGWC